MNKTLRGLGPADELEQLAAQMGPNRGHYKRMRLEPASPAAPPIGAGPRGHIAPNAPTSRPRARRWKASEMIAAGVAGVAALGAITAAVIASATHGTDVPPPAPPAPKNPGRSRP